MHSNIKATIIADSVSPQGVRLTTFEIEYPRFILAELNTHRMLSKNSASSRAIPSESLHKHILQHPARPVFWGKNQPGMKAKEALEPDFAKRAQRLWDAAIHSSILYSSEMASLGLHKQIANRPVELGMTMKTVISGTEWNNLWHLRDHEDAQPEFAALAKAMRQEYDNSTPAPLAPGEWHLPYIDAYRLTTAMRAEYVNSTPVLLNPDEGHLPYIESYRLTTGSALRYFSQNGEKLSLEDARIISASCCAQVSYRKNDDNIDKARKIYKQLIESTPAHASPVEHQATPMPTRYATGEYSRDWPEGISHQDRDGNYWSGNFKGWIQFRKLIPNEQLPG